MNKYPLIGGSICAVVLIVLASLTNIVGYQTVHALNQKMNPFSKGPVLEVTTDKTVYNVSEQVTTFLTNIGNETLSGGGPIITIYNDENKIMYQEAAYGWYELDPGEYIEWSPWNQTDQQGQQVPVGLYVVEGFLSGGDNNYIDNATFFILNNTPPIPPIPPNITGPYYGKINTNYTFSLGNNTDPDGDQLYALWDWGDGSYSGWPGPFVTNASHSWNKPGNYTIHARFRDVWGALSNWSAPFLITIVQLKPAFFLGSFEYFNQTDDLFIMNGQTFIVFPSHPIFYKGVTIVISKNYLGHLGTSFILGIGGITILEQS